MKPFKHHNAKPSKNLKIALESEIYGEALFRNALKTCMSKKKKQKLEKLLALEIKTKEKILTYYKRKGFRVPANRSHAVKGKVQGLAIPLLWKTAMKATLKETDYFLAAFTALKAEADPADAELFQYIIDHEEAIQAFARNELAGNKSESIDAVTALL